MVESELDIMLQKMDREDIPRLVREIREAKKHLQFAGLLSYANGYDQPPVDVPTSLVEMAEMANTIAKVEANHADEQSALIPRVENEAARIMKDLCYQIALDVQSERDGAAETPWDDDCREIARRISLLSNDSIIPDSFYYPPEVWDTENSSEAGEVPENE